MSSVSGSDTESEDSYVLESPEKCCLQDGDPCSACVKLALLDERAEEPSFSLARERLDLLRQANEWHDPILRLPLEIACFIFELCLPNHIEGDDDEVMLNYYRRTSQMDSIPPGVPEVLSRVCHQWRQIAFATSRLWTTLPIYLNESNSERQLEIIQHWAQRSGNRPLSIGMWTDQEWYEQGKQHILARILAWESTFDFVNSLAPRWRTLQLFLPGFALPWITGNGQFPASFQCLDIIGFSFPVYRDDDRASEAFLLTRDKPKPSRVCIHRSFYKNIHVDWCNITTIDLSFFGAEDCMTILLELHQLHSLSLEMMIYDLDEEDWTFPLVHKALRVLSVYDVSIDDGFSLLNCMTFPGLVEFKFWCFDFDKFEDAVSLLSRSGCSLTKFTTLNVSLSSMEEIDFFRKPFATHLANFYPHFFLTSATSFLAALDSSDIAGDVLLPELRSLSLNFWASELLSISECTTFWTRLYSLITPVNKNGGQRVRVLREVRIVIRDSDDVLGPLALSTLIITYNVWNREHPVSKDFRGLRDVVSIVDTKGEPLI